MTLCYITLSTVWESFNSWTRRRRQARVDPKESATLMGVSDRVGGVTKSSKMVSLAMQALRRFGPSLVIACVDTGYVVNVSIQAVGPHR